MGKQNEFKISALIAPPRWPGAFMLIAGIAFMYCLIAK